MLGDWLSCLTVAPANKLDLVVSMTKVVPTNANKNMYGYQGHQDMECIVCGQNASGQMMICYCQGSRWSNYRQWVRDGLSALCPNHHHALGQSTEYQAIAQIADNSSVAKIACDRYMDRTRRILWEHRDSGDIVVTCKDKKWQVHSLLLTAASSVLAAMLQGQMKEALERSIDIPTSEPETVEALLHFIYLGSLPENSNTLDVCHLAHMYGVEEVIESCCGTLIESVDVDNVAEILKLLRACEKSDTLKCIYQHVRCMVHKDHVLFDAIIDKL
eukprot:gnl/TRDRNA2_/TRDRNA2_59387_c0_seq1.p1 gnl/TRDRNA2_/TRDRNA2_59387_c0~~gnl/TRDRNA2_/TRDRNA2_59387_c0_seq1.p1  ORF type:complete len:273 (-),score=36.95 gnl/TRDRNA2_/TRDRNA2_59387_c0_seq1:268-1086(-)